MKKMLYYTSGIGLGGVERALLNILNLLDKKKLDIKVGFQHANENNFESEIPKKIDFEYMLPQNQIDKILNVQENKKNNLLYKIYYSFLLKKERKIIKKNYLKYSEDRDIIIDFKSSDYARLTLLDERKKKICWYHTSIKNSNAYKRNPKRLRKNLNRYNKIIVTCDDMKKEMIEMFPELEEKIIKIYNPFDFEKIIFKSKELETLDKDEKLAIEEKYIIMVSRIETKIKDYNTLLDAYQVFLKENPTVKLYLLGDGPNRKEIEDMISERKLEKNVIILGQKNNPYVWIKNSECLIHSSKYEGFGMVLVEAMILGIPVISTNCPVGPREILEDGKNGVLVEVGNSKEMALKLNELIGDVKLREKYINNATKSIERFSSKKIKTQIEKLLEEI